MLNAVKATKSVSGKRVAFVSRAAGASRATCRIKGVIKYRENTQICWESVSVLLLCHNTARSKVAYLGAHLQKVHTSCFFRNSLLVSGQCNV